MSHIWFARGCPGHLKGDLKVAGWKPVGPAVTDRFDACGVMAATEPYTAGVIDGMRNLAVISRMGIHLDGIDLDACTERGILVANTPDAPTISTAEHTMALILSVAHQVVASAERLRRGEAGTVAEYRSLQWGMELRGATLGLVGCGRVGGRVRALAQAIGMRVLVYDPLHPDTIPFEDLLAQSDVVSLHVPATKATIGMFNAEAFSLMKPGSILINCARGSVVVTDDLLDALDSGLLMGAGLDCTEPELLPGDHPLLHRDDVIVTPHVGSATLVGQARTERMAFHQIVLALRGERPTELRNPKAFEHPRWSQSD